MTPEKLQNTYLDEAQKWAIKAADWVGARDLDEAWAASRAAQDLIRLASGTLSPARDPWGTADEACKVWRETEREGKSDKARQAH